MKMGAAPLSSMLSSMSIEYSEETLAPNIIKVDNERMSILHCSPRSLVLGDTDLKARMMFGVSIQDLDNQSTEIL